MESTGDQTIVVGIDGSATSDAALGWAVEEATRRGLRLHLVSAAVHRTHGGDFAYDDADIDAAIASQALRAADSRLAAAVATARESAPDLVITTESSLDRAADALVERSAGAYGIVVGRSGHGPLVGAVLGSVAAQVLTHAHCPVIVVPVPGGLPALRRGVAVAVDGSHGSDLALALAFQEASERDTPLLVIHSWWTRATAGGNPDTRADQLTGAQLELAGAMTTWSEQYPDVEVRVSLPVGPTVLAITDASRDSELLVVGSRGRGGFGGLMLGSVSQGVLARAGGTVIVVRP